MDGPRGDVEDILRLEYYPNEAGQGHNRGQLRAITNALGQTTVFSDYSPLGKPGKIIDASGLETSLSYNFRGDVLERASGGLVTSYSYDAAGRLLGVSLPGGRRLSYSYSGGRLASITDALGNAISYSYDALGRQSAQELRDPENTLRYSLHLAYDQAGNLAKRMYADNSEEQFAYDPVANLVRSVDPLGVVSEYGYDALGRQLTEKRAGEQIAGYGYDSQDNIIGVTDARSHVTTSVYDDFGRERQVVSPDAGTSASVYDEAGNLLSQTNALGERVELSWDTLNRPLRIQWPGAVRPVAFSWDQGTVGRLTSIQEEEFDRHFSYTSLGQVAAESFSRDGAVSLTVGYGYDEATGELSSITYPSGTVLRYSRDAAGRISAVRFGEHDLATAVRYLPFGPVQGMQLGNITQSRSYDQRYQLSRIQAGSLDSVYTRNAAGQVTGIEGLATPGVESGSESYTIDAASNQLAVRGGTSYTYDAAGRLLSDGIRTFSWDALGRLRQVEANAVVLASYGYDSQNRRVRKTVGTNTTYYLYDLENRLTAEISGSGTVLREYIWLENEPLALREYELWPGLYFYINDHLGTPQQLVDSQGAVVWQAAYLPFGEAQLRVGTVTNNLKFPGQYFDAETGLHYNWNRYYDPDTGCHLSLDPVRLGGKFCLSAHATETTAVEVGDGLHDFLFRVHDKRPMSDNRLVQRFAAQKEQQGVVVGVKTHTASSLIEGNQLGLAGRGLFVDLHGSPQNHDGRVPSGGCRELHALTGFQAQIPDVHGRKGSGRTGVALVATGQNAQGSGFARQIYQGKFTAENGLVARRAHLVLGRKVHPELHHVQPTARAGKAFGMEFLVEDAAGGGHPLDIAGADGAALAGGIPVRDLAFVNDGHGLEAPVRMLAHAPGPGRGAELRGGRVVEQQKRAQIAAMVVVGKEGVHGKSVANPVLAGRIVDFFDFFHDCSLDVLVLFQEVRQTGKSRSGERKG